MPVFSCLLFSPAVRGKTMQNGKPVLPIFFSAGKPAQSKSPLPRRPRLFRQIISSRYLLFTLPAADMSAGSAVIFRTERAKQLFDLSRFSLKEKFPPAKLYPGYILADNPTAGISKKCAERGAGQGGSDSEGSNQGRLQGELKTVILRRISYPPNICAVWFRRFISPGGQSLLSRCRKLSFLPICNIV